MKAVHGRRRVVIGDVNPQIDAGEYPVRRILGDEVNVTAAIFADGKDELAARVLYRHSSDSRWRLAPMLPTENDLWSSTFQVDKLGAWRFTIQGWVDHFATWAKDLKKRIAAQSPPTPEDAASTASENPEVGIEIGANPAAQDVALALQTGALLLHEAAERARRNDAKRLREIAESFEKLAEEKRAMYDDPCDEALMELTARYPDLANAAELDTELPIWVDRERARFSAWYELFPRSASPVPGQHGTFRDVEKQLPEIAAMGFDILYMPPIHPIGRAFRKGPNNATEALPDAPGSPWAIGDREAQASAPASVSKKAVKKVAEDQGGHKSIHPQL